jgi:DNA-binding LytR/AlgR family response regulator
MCGDAQVLDGRRLLLVEDSFPVADALAWELSSFGAAEVKMCAVVDDALEQIEARRFDVALLDVNVNGQSVLPVAERLSKVGVPFVFVTGYSDTQMLGGQFSDVPCYCKPVSASAIVPTLVDLIKQNGRGQ